MKDERRKMKEKIRTIQLKLSKHFNNNSRKEISLIRKMYNEELQKYVKNVEDLYKNKLQNLMDINSRLRVENSELRKCYKLYRQLKEEHERVASVFDTTFLRNELNKFISIIDKTKDKIDLLDYKDSKLKLPSQ